MNRYHPALLLMIAVVVVGAVGGVIAVAERTGSLDGSLAVNADAGTDSVTPTREPLPPSVTVVAEPWKVGQNGSFRVSAHVYNALSEPRAETLSLRIDRDRDGRFESTVGKRDVTLSGAGVTVVEFQVPSGWLEPGRYPFSFGPASDNDAWTSGTLELRAATFTVRSVGDETVVQGTTALVPTTLSNEGGFDGTRPVSLHVDRNHDGRFSDAERVMRTNLSIPANATRAFELESPTAGLDPGTYQFQVTTSESAREGVLRILRPATFRVRTLSGETVAVRGDPVRLSLTVENVGDVAGSQNVTVGVDEDGDGLVNDSEVLAERQVTIGQGGNATLQVELRTAGLVPGNYTLVASTESGERTSTLSVLRPATFVVSNVTAADTVRRGEDLRVSATITNVGAVPGNRTIGLDVLNTSANTSRTLSLGPGDRAVVTLTVPTAPLSRGANVAALTTGDSAAEVTFNVTDGLFEIDRLSGRTTLRFGDDVSFSARVINTGPVRDTQTVELRIDLDGDDEPEPYNVSARVSLGPGEETTVTLGLETPGSELSRTNDSLLGSHIVGVFSEDSNATSVFSVKPRQSSSGSTSSSGAADTASLDEISQSKYGVSFEQLSGETQRQVRELHERQPFADDLVVTEVLTREEIARERYGVDVEPNEPFNFTALDVELQQRIEAEFDEQFESDTGDRIESWDELALSRYGTTYENLSAAEQETIREAYWEQFE